MYQPMKRGRERAADLVSKAGYGSVRKHLAAGGANADREADIKLITSAMNQHTAQEHGGKKTRLHFREGGHAEGGMAEPRLDHRARGGGAQGKGKDGKHRPSSQVNVVISPHSGQPPGGPPMASPMLAPHPPMMAGPPPGGPPMPPPHPPMPMPPPGGPPMGGPPPGMMPPGAPPPGMPPRPMIKTGGKASMTAGAGSGAGREEKSERRPNKRAMAGEC